MLFFSTSWFFAIAHVVLHISLIKDLLTSARLLRSPVIPELDACRFFQVLDPYCRRCGSSFCLGYHQAHYCAGHRMIERRILLSLDIVFDFGAHDFPWLGRARLCSFWSSWGSYDVLAGCCIPIRQPHRPLGCIFERSLPPEILHCIKTGS
ncbi:hypothetical protein BOTBODRAFT_473263 [Botryobasidium botryosum FD-172 SS1]|uniref:Uncharacterized protein n=1 Tax=Botryobasidium botryosum (strain FD-172 SS1) TaxID=930990 RepID=A0A067M4T0_BOTB1|nr:hypothetical protein BOTBODRAFT_473263 [Botryobasidium botryosum FD-172 SS1]